MNTKRLVLLATGLLALNGCASMNSMPAGKDSTARHDTRYVGAVNYAAQRLGTHVIWVNPPRAPASKNVEE